MKTRHQRTILFLGVFLLSVSLACSAGLSASQSPVDRRPAQPTPATQGGQSEPGGGTVTVTEEDFHLVFEPAQPAAGEVTFVVKNQGQVPHDFHIQGNGVDHTTALIEPGGSTTFTVRLEPGTYDYKCSVPGHDMLGMEGSFIVEAGSFSSLAQP